jgi:GR25 family glycosyltransferase involved in LPS biosynthesis
MKCYVITLKDNEDSLKAASKCIHSSREVSNNFDVIQFDAITPDRVDEMMKNENIKWNYPWEGTVVDFSSGLTKNSYPTKNKKARIACSLSHYHLWKSCAFENESYMILEHDAFFIDKIDYNNIEQSLKLIISINNPRFATRRAVDYLNKIKQSYPDKQGIVSAPYIDDMNIPQGLPGNSAYIIKPKGAKKMLQLVKDYGLWPNDALMCNQLIPQLGCTQKFYTRVQGIRSTTSL